MSKAKQISDELNKLMDLDKVLDNTSHIFSKEYQELSNKKNELYKLFYEYDKFINKEISFSYFELVLNIKTNEFFDAKKHFTEMDIRNFIDELKKLELFQIKVARSIQGIELKQKENIYKLADFEIYHFPTHKDYLVSLTNMNPEILFHKQKHEYLIGINVVAREPNRAAEIADKYFKRFELCFYFIKGIKDSHHELGILNYSGINPNETFVLSKKGGFRSSSSTGAFRKINIDDEYFINKTDGYDTLWTLLTKDKPNNLENKIINSVMWAGESIWVKEPAIAFIQVATALEILLTYSEPKQIITPSITHQIAEAAAIIIGETTQERIKIESDIKNLYGKRSAIAHAGLRDIEAKDYYTFFFYVKELIVELIINEKFSKINSVGELHKLIKQIKYS